MKWQPDDNALNANEKILYAHDSRENVEKWISNHAPDGHYVGKDYNGNQVDVVEVTPFQIAGKDNTSKWCAIGI